MDWPQRGLRNLTTKHPSSIHPKNAYAKTHHHAILKYWFCLPNRPECSVPMELLSCPGVFGPCQNEATWALDEWAAPWSMKYTSTHWNVPLPSGKWRLTNPSQDKKTCHRFLPINWSPNGWPKNLEKHRSCQGPVGRLQPSHPKIPVNASPKKTGRNFQVSRENLESRQFIWGFLKWWVSPTTMGLPTKNDQHLGCELGVPPFKETPICRVYYTDYILAKWGDDIPPFQKLALFITCSTTNIHWTSRSNVRWIYYVGFPGVDSEIWCWNLKISPNRTGRFSLSKPIDFRWTMLNFGRVHFPKLLNHLLSRGQLAENFRSFDSNGAGISCARNANFWVEMTMDHPSTFIRQKCSSSGHGPVFYGCMVTGSLSFHKAGGYPAKWYGKLLPSRNCV